MVLREQNPEIVIGTSAVNNLGLPLMQENPCTCQPSGYPPDITCIYTGTREDEQ
jgi:hypothetical protein